jgi:ArsR family transcriptional regulator
MDAIEASLLRTLASPQRLRLLHLLGEHPREVNELARALGLGQAAVSQHLSSMRSVGLVEAVRDGRSVRYQLTDPEILTACALMRGVIVRRLSALGRLAAAAGQPEPVARPPRTRVDARTATPTPHSQVPTR